MRGATIAARSANACALLGWVRVHALQRPWASTPPEKKEVGTAGTFRELELIYLFVAGGGGGRVEREAGEARYSASAERLFLQRFE